MDINLPQEDSGAWVEPSVCQMLVFKNESGVGEGL